MSLNSINPKQPHVVCLSFVFLRNRDTLKVGLAAELPFFSLTSSLVVPQRTLLVGHQHLHIIWHRALMTLGSYYITVFKLKGAPLVTFKQTRNPS